MILKMVQRGGVGNSGQAGALSNRDGLGSFGPHDFVDCIEEGLAQLPVMIFLLNSRHTKSLKDPS